MMKPKAIKIGLALIIVVVSVFALFLACEKAEQDDDDDSVTSDERPDDTKPDEKGQIWVEFAGNFDFEPAEIQTKRPDIFNEGYFSVFDVLAQLSDKKKVDLEYHFDEETDTYVIDSLNGKTNWWYKVWYSGGWPEVSVHRMDYYPVKDQMHIAFVQSSTSESQRRMDIWKTEVVRRVANSGQVIVPTVEIQFKGKSLVFENLRVEPHNLRDDFFKAGTITAVDAIMTLGDQDAITYELLWYDRIGSAVIGNYYVESIHDDSHSGKCGFVYEVGEKNPTTGNHIHVTPDIRVLHSPQYILFFWIELGEC